MLHVQLHLDFQEEELLLDMAAINLWQISFNLVSNARDHATSNVWVRARKETIDDGKPYHMRVPNGVALHLIVEDDGPGVSNEIATSIFAPTVTSTITSTTRSQFGIFPSSVFIAASSPANCVSAFCRKHSRKHRAA